VAAGLELMKKLVGWLQKDMLLLGTSISSQRKNNIYAIGNHNKPVNDNSSWTNSYSLKVDKVNCLNDMGMGRKSLFGPVSSSGPVSSYGPASSCGPAYILKGIKEDGSPLCRVTGPFTSSNFTSRTYENGDGKCSGVKKGDV
jgi:hypothetical protein